MRNRPNRRDETLGDRLADLAEGDVFVGGTRRSREPGARSRGGRLDLPGTGFDVALDDATARTRALDEFQIDASVLCNASGERRSLHPCRVGLSSNRCGCLCGACRGRRCGGSCGWLRGRNRGRLGRPSSRLLTPNSITALSVSTSASVSPDVTGSPSCFVHFTRRPSSIVGDKASMWTFVAIVERYSR